MKFLVISDTHGKIDAAAELGRELAGIDAIIHLGDYEKDARALSEILGMDVISVKGDMDNGFHPQDAFRILETEAGKLLLTHGHMQNVKSSLNGLLFLAEEQECTAALFGHTHLPLIERANGILFVNPGSLSLPAGGGDASYAIVTTAVDGVRAELRFRAKPKPSESSPQNSSSKVRGGFLRDILNNSDRL